MLRARVALILGLIVAAQAGCKTAGPDSAIKDDQEFPISGGLSGDVEYDEFDGRCTPEGKYCVYFAPADMPVKAVDKLMRQAKKRIRIATYNMNVGWYSMDILRKKLQQGVDVEFMVDYKLSFGSNRAWNNLAKWYKDQNFNSGAGKLRLWRIPVLRGRNPQMHNKIIIVDDQIVAFGSANWTFSGLAGNYENVMVVNGHHAVTTRFSEELDELRATGEVACELFVSDNSKCGTGSEGDLWNDSFKNLATRGKFPEQLIDSENTACKYLKWGLMNEVNMPRAGANYSEEGELSMDWDELAGCFTDENLGGRFAQLAKRVFENERYADGVRVADKPPVPRPNFFKYSPQAEKSFKVFFSPEDNIEWEILKELRSTYQAGEAEAKQSFAYVSTNFITNRNFAKELVKMKEAGVRLRVFFDRGRYVDDNFQHAVGILEPLGFTTGGPGDHSELVTIFDNQLSGPYGCNHNKMAVLYTPKDGLRVINGSANWSVSAVKSNDENLTISYDERLAMIFMREILSQLYVYRYAQDANDGFRNEINYLTKSSFLKYNKDCMRAVLESGKSCETFTVNNWGKRNSGSTTWKPNFPATLLVSAKDVPGDPSDVNLWAWVSAEQSENNWTNFGSEAFTYDTFSGRWVTAVPYWPGRNIKYKLFTAPKGFDPNVNGPNGSGLQWEDGDDFQRQMPPYAIFGIQDGDWKFR